MAKSEETASFYKETLPEVIVELKNMVENNLEIVSKNIDPTLPDNKLRAAIESRRKAVEDIIWAGRQVDTMQYQLDEIPEEEQELYFEKSFFRRIIPRLIKQIKGMVENNLKIVGKEISELLKDDQVKSALNSRRIGAEDVVWASRTVDELENELTGKTNESEDERLVHWTKRNAKKGDSLSRKGN